VIPLGTLICVTGVSGSGKSSLINQTLHPALAGKYHHSGKQTLPYRELTGIEYLDKVIEVDQSPIGRTPRSNPAHIQGFLPISGSCLSRPLKQKLEDSPQDVFHSM
jgi:excinuclease ABC subunit A